MTEIIDEEIYKIRFKLVNNLPHGLVIGQEIRPARNYANGDIFIVRCDWLVEDLERITEKKRLRLKDAVEILRENNWSDGQIEVALFIVVNAELIEDGSVIKNAEFVLTKLPIHTRNKLHPVLELRVENKLIAQIPLYIKFAQAKKIIHDQGFILLSLFNNLNGKKAWLVPAKIAKKSAPTKKSAPKRT